MSGSSGDPLVAILWSFECMLWVVEKGQNGDFWRVLKMTIMDRNSRQSVVAAKSETAKSCLLRCRKKLFFVMGTFSQYLWSYNEKTTIFRCFGEMGWESGIFW